MSARTRIFIVDDDRDLAESLADVLESRGYEVELACSGEEGVARFREAEFDLVFMDVKLPGMNGVESFFEFRKIKPDAKVMMMTGYSVEQLLVQAIENGALGVLHKPFAVTEIIAVLDRVKPQGIVLVADDDPDFAASMEPILRSAGYRVALAENGEDAVTRVAAGGIDCLILDLRLPVLSGVEVYLRLKQLGKLVPTIIVTGHAKEEEGRATEVRSGAAGFLVKPFDPSVLLSTIAGAAH